RPSARYPTPRATVCVWALAADTEDEARRLLKTREHWRVGFERGERKQLVTPEYAEAYSYDAAARGVIEALRRKAIAGTAETVASRLRDVARELDLDELVVVTWTHDAAARHRSYELLAQAFDLSKCLA
ncbi:MAG TPA: LLM class flavin-dependent oxidoreductase, partial [Casimicrobiaceae bacterium]|nr:LLM class flavin-dependent oxidoreductase [Casimicrobiaceae bacterium]